MVGWCCDGALMESCKNIVGGCEVFFKRIKKDKNWIAKSSHKMKSSKTESCFTKVVLQSEKRRSNP